MSTSRIYRLGGLSLLVGALIMIVGVWVRLNGSDLAAIVQPIYSTSWLLNLIGGLFLLLGLTAMYAYQSRQAGTLGLIGFVLAFLGLAALEVGTSAIDGGVRPLLAVNPATQSLAQTGSSLSQGGPGFDIVFLIGFVAIILGEILYGIATLRARVFPRWAAVLIIVGVPAIFLGGLLPVVGNKPEALTLLGLAWCGYFLLANKGVPAAKSI